MFIAVIIFIILAVIIAVVFGKSAKTALELQAGEKVLSDEAPVRVEQQTPIQTGIFSRCRVMVTNRRVIISQAPIFGKNYTVPRYFVTFSDTENQTDLGSTIKKGFLQMAVPRSALQIEPNDDKNTDARYLVTIPVPDSGLTSGQFIKFPTAHPEGFR